MNKGETETWKHSQTPRMQAAIIVLSFNSLEDTTMPCLDSIYSAKTNVSFETVVVDNSSTDGTRDYLRQLVAEKKYKNFGFVLNEKNEGFSKGNNIGIRAVDAECYVLLNSDTIVTDYWLDKLVSFLQTHPDVGMVGPVSNAVGNEQCIFAEKAMEAEIVACGLDWAGRCEGDYFFTDMLGFFCVAVKREVFDKVGLLDEGFGVGFFEDDDFCMTALESGFKLACREDVFIYHKGSMSFNLIDTTERQRIFDENLRRFEEKHQTAWHTRYSAKQFTKLVGTYLAGIDANNADKVRYKCVNKLRLAEATYFSEINMLEDQKHALENQKHVLEEQLNAIYRSRFWKVANAYYKIRDRSTIGRSIYNALRSVRKNGVAGSFRKSAHGVISRMNSWGVAIGSHEGSCSAKHGRCEDDKIYGGGLKGRVSIVLPVYNQANYLAAAVESVLNQRYEDIELIIVNDGSTDGVEKVLDIYSEHPKIKILTQENQKLPNALNNGFAHATGEFLTWTSADNIMLPDQIEELVSFLNLHPGTAMVYSDYQAVDDKGLPLNDPLFRPHNQDRNDPSIMRLPREATFENLHDSGDNFIGASFMYRRYAAKVVGTYAHDTFGGEDYDYWLRLNSLFKIEHIDKVLYKYRVHDNTLNAKARELNLFENIKRLLERDQARRKFYRKSFAVIWVGFGQKNRPLSAADDKVLIVFKYSLKESAEVTEHLTKPHVISVCVVDRQIDEYCAIDETLSRCDYIITTDIATFELLSSEYENKLFSVQDVKEHIDFIIKMADSRLFNKRAVSPDGTTPGTIYLGDRRLNVALQVDNFDKGGLEQVIYDLAMHIKGDRFNRPVVVVTKTPGYMATILKTRGIEVLECGKNIDAYENVLRSRKIDILNTHHSYFGVDKAAELGIGVIETIHNSYTWVDSEAAKELVRLDRFTAKYVAVSRQVKNYHRRRFGVPYGKITIIPNGLNLDGLNGTHRSKLDRKDIGFSEKDFIFLNVASFNGVKCHHLMLTAMKSLICDFPDIKLLLIGSVLDRVIYNDIIQRIKAEGLDKNIRIMDYLERNRLAEIYQLADCFILPSLQEGWSIAAMEAMYFKLPLILTDIGSATDIVSNSDIGIIVKNPYADITTLTPVDIADLSTRKHPRNLTDLKRAMLAIYRDRALWKSKGSAGKDKIINEFSLEKMARLYEDTFVATWGIYRKCPPWRNERLRGSTLIPSAADRLDYASQGLTE